MFQYTAMTRNAKGATQAVTVRAHGYDHARRRLVEMGYHEILWVL